MNQPLTTEELDQIESTTTDPNLTPGPWDLAYEACDCGGDYPCGHGPYVTGVITPVPTAIAAERCKRTGEEPRDYDFHRGEIGDFTEADWVLMVSARQNVATLLAEVHRLRAELATAHVQAIRELADKADPQRPEISFFGDHGHEVGAWMRKQAEYAAAAAVPAVPTTTKDGAQ